MKPILDYFMQNEVPVMVKNGEIDNEFGLQFELGYYLRKKGYKVYFEKNINNKNTCKHEIDLVVQKDNKRYAIELKFQKGINVGRTVAIYNFIKDIKFAEELKKINFDATYCITMVDCDSYYKITGKERNTDWLFFRGKVNNNRISAQNKLRGNIQRKVKKVVVDSYSLTGEYQIEWTNIGENLWSYVLEI